MKEGKWGGGEGKEKSGPDQPDETFCSSVFFRLELIDDEVLDGFGFERCSELSFSDFLPSIY